ncbi:MAG: hypothetical protein AAGN35_03650 [Bacteroidota bacterium]
MKSPGFSSTSWIIALGLLLGALLPATVQAQEAFEGSFSFAIRLSGKQAPEFLANEPANVMNMHLKEDNFIIHLSGGRIARTFLFIGDSNHTYVIDAANRRAFRRTYFQEDSTATPPKAKPTGKKIMIKNIECEEYLVTKSREKTKIYYYVSDQYRVDTQAYAGKDKAKADFLTLGLEGRIPLRKIIKTPSLTTEIDLRNAQPRDLDIENFRIPESFKLRGRDPRK